MCMCVCVYAWGCVPPVLATTMVCNEGATTVLLCNGVTAKTKQVGNSLGRFPSENHQLPVMHVTIGIMRYNPILQMY